MTAYTGPFPFTNNGTVNSIAVTDTTFSGGLINDGSINPGGIALTNSTIDGYIVDNGPTIAGGISIDSASQILSNTYFGILVEEDLAGGITNSGSITANYSAIDVDGVASFVGGIVNTGTLAAGADGIDLSGVTFGGGVSNGGTITAANSGVAVFYDAFSGGISNSGTISAANVAIDVDSRTFSGGISNGGIITSVATAIDLVSITAFSGGISNSGTVSSTFDEGISVAIITEFSGNIVNSGKILAGDADGIEVQQIRTFAGAISNDGTINTFDTGIDLASVSTLTGGITNSGIISTADDPGILLNVMSMFSGGVSNSGTISSAGDQGIEVESVSVFFGGVSNSGTIDADFTGINLVSDSAFSGGVANSGSINSKLGYGINIEAVTTFGGGVTSNGNVTANETGISVDFVSSFAGGIVNSGSLNSTHFDGIDVAIVGMFAGGITSSGSISSADIGIAVNPASVFSGGISNFGTVMAAVTGISISNVSTFSGGIVNSGSVAGGSGPGIELFFVSKFSGGISNSGTITGEIGIQAWDSGPVSIFDSGSITGTGGTAVDLLRNAGGNTLTLGPGYSITGTVAGSGSDTFQLGGTGDGSFNLTNLGTQYTGFSTFDVVSGAWTVTGTFSQFAPWTVAGGTLIENGTLSDGVTVDNGGTLVLSAGNGVGGVVSLQSGSTLAFDTSFSYEGPISIAGAADFSVAAGQTATLAFPIVDSVAQAGELVKTGAGTLVLSALDGPEFYHGGTIIDAGTLEIGAGNVVPGNATFGSAGATLRLDSGVNQIGGGAITGATGGDAIDLGFVAFAAGDQAVWQQTTASAGVLSIETANGSTLATLDLTGQYVPADFKIGADSQNDVLINVVTPHKVDDFNADGISDIFWRNSSDDSLVTWLMNGSAVSSGTYVTYQGNAIAPDASWSVAGIGDFNGDGDADILWRQNTSGALVDWSMNGSVVEADAYVTYQGNTITPDSSWSVAGIGDFNGDGHADILWRQSTTGTLVDWTMNGSAVEADAYVTDQGNAVAPDSSWSVAGIGDFNGDGHADILWRQSTTGSLVEWQMNGSQVASSSFVTSQGSPITPDSTWSVAGIGDFNGDGDADVLWRQSTTGSLAIWLMNGSAVTSGNIVTNQGNAITPDSTWSVVEVGNFNNSGNASILWQQSSSGALVEWQMNGSQIASAQTVTSQGNAITPPANTWQVQAKPTDFA